MPAYNEAAGIEAVVRGFLAISEVDEVVVADNASSDGTGVKAAFAGARVVREERRGYGYACRAALAASDGDLVVLVESDSTFVPRDLYKFLTYAEDFDVVFGTRTSKACIWSGSNMGNLLRYGNCAVAKLLEYVHNGPCLTDVGCTYKLFTRPALRQILPVLEVGDSRLSPEVIIAAVRLGFRCVEIPVMYGSRVGESKITGDSLKAFTLGLAMIELILRYRFRSFQRLPEAEAGAAAAQ